MILTSIGILIIIFIINVIPAFMPPTWILLSIIGYNFNLNNYSLVILSIFAAIAATSGRAVLAIFSDKIIRNKILSKATRNNIDVLKNNIENKKTITSGFFLFYAFSPLPSGQLFLAYGLTDLKLKMAIIPFFVGRLSSYIFWALTASKLSKITNLTLLQTSFFFSTYFILAQVAALYLVYLFTKIDWKILFTEHKVRFLKKIIS